jgi:hypothetical protein
MSLNDIDMDELDVGTVVEARYRGGTKYYPGKITRIGPGGTFDVLYDDGERETGVKRGLIRSKAGSGSPMRGGQSGSSSSNYDAELREGSVIEADYRGRGKFYAGKITRVRLNGTYDIDYNDGEKEQSVARNLIRVKSR